MRSYLENKQIGELLDVIEPFFTFNSLNSDKNVKRHACTFKEIMEGSHLSKRKVAKYLQMLRENGYLIEKREREKRGRPKVIHYLKVNSPSPVVSCPDNSLPNEGEAVFMRDGLGRSIGYMVMMSKRKRLKYLRNFKMPDWDASGNPCLKNFIGHPIWEGSFSGRKYSYLFYPMR